MMLSVTAELLGKYYEVVGTVGDGHALLDAIGKLSPDVVVVDIGMPRMHGRRGGYAGEKSTIAHPAGVLDHPRRC